MLYQSRKRRSRRLERTPHFILLDTIEYLERGGSASRLMPVIKKAVSFLRIEPLLTVVDGKLKLLSVARSYRRGMVRMSQEVIGLRPLEKVAVIHIRRLQLAEQLAEDISQQLDYPHHEIVLLETGAVLSCQGGPGILLFFVSRRGSLGYWCAGLGMREVIGQEESSGSGCPDRRIVGIEESAHAESCLEIDDQSGIGKGGLC